VKQTHDEQCPSNKKNQHFSNIVIFHTYLPMKMEQTEGSETSDYKIQTPENYPEESIQHSEHGESLKSIKFKTSHILYTAAVFKGILVRVVPYCSHQVC
jgi:hypothetical protein